MQFTAIAWNLFHGRDFPPDPGLFTWRSRLLGCSEANATHVQVNRDLRPEFAGCFKCRLGRRPAAGVPAALWRRRSAEPAGPKPTGC